MGHCKRPKTREFAPTNSGSRTKPERINLRCMTEDKSEVHHELEGDE